MPIDCNVLPSPARHQLTGGDVRGRTEYPHVGIRMALLGGYVLMLLS